MTERDKKKASTQDYEDVRMAGWQDRFKRVMSLRLDFAQHGCFNVCSNVFAGGLAWLFFLLQQFID